jgi:hypothetical protein
MFVPCRTTLLLCDTLPDVQGLHGRHAERRVSLCKLYCYSTGQPGRYPERPTALWDDLSVTLFD